MKLTIGCDACVDKVCASDKYCCETAWDAICTYRASTTCNVACPGDPATPNCKTLYGSTIGYSLCAENATTCEFAINQTQNTCAAACAKAGGECVASFNDVNNNPCQKPQAPNLGTKSCDSTQWQSAICICSRGCGAGLPCPAGKSCKAGACG
ncbi:MAG: hypothetical protein FJ095_18390 [Deltaproteobacteria bacterium]|nr:hypothetical protein [Deltaproteobacteria bacterium]